MSLLFAGIGSTKAADPLPSWNDTKVKQAIISFVTAVTNQNGPDYVLPIDRIATFDNDGTLWVEKPLPTEVYFVLDRLKEMEARDPALTNRQPFKAAVEGDEAYFHEAGVKAVIELIMVTHANLTQEQFAKEARTFLTKAQHPKLKRPFPQLAYQPMLELLAYLRANSFETWLCSGGTSDFMRVFTLETYGVPPQQVIGTTFKRETKSQDGRMVIWRLPAIDSICDKTGKPINIDQQIGKRPIFVAGNVLSGGDIAMMEYSKGNRPSLQLLVDHDDAEREFAYQEKNNESLDAAKKYGFTVVSMKNDWKTIFKNTAAQPGGP